MDFAGQLREVDRSINRFQTGVEDYPGIAGSIPFVSSNGGLTGTAVVWAIDRGDPLTLFAYDALNLGHLLFKGHAGSWPVLSDPDSEGPNAKQEPHIGGAFTVPTVVNGKVYVGSASALTVFGLK